MAAVARLTEGTQHARRGRELVERALDDRDFRVRMEAAAALVTLQDARAIPPLERAARVELDGRARRRMREAVSELTEKGRPAEQARKVSEEVERLRNELGDMRSRLEKLEARPSRAGGNGGSAASGPKEGGRRPRPRTRRGSKPARRGR